MNMFTENQHKVRKSSWSLWRDIVDIGRFDPRWTLLDKGPKIRACKENQQRIKQVTPTRIYIVVSLYMYS